MKINNVTLTVILSVLIVVILSAGILLIVTLNSASEPTVTTAETTVSTVAQTTKAPITIDPSILNPPPITTAPPSETTPPPSTTTSKPAETTKTPETTKIPETTVEPETNAPTTDEPTTSVPESNEPSTSAPSTTVAELKPISGTIEGESISSLRIFAVYETESIDQDARTLTVKISFFVESYGLQVGGRTTNYMTVDGKKIRNLHTDRINLPDGSPRTRTLLYEYVATIEKPDNDPATLELEYHWNCKLYYSGEYVEYLSIKLDLTA